ncbi:MAG: Hpt domain-containing protein [Acidobacteria bacterium]|nr:Hpt domain-containing protein [Acidobacteriota bacterium]
MVKKIDPEILMGFIEEAKSYLPTILDCIDTFKHDPDQLDALEEAHRLFHSIKGAASMVGLSALSHVAYFAEEALEEIAAGQLEFTPDTTTVFLLTVSQVESYLDGILSGTLDDQAILVEVVKSFRRLKHLPPSGDEAAIETLVTHSQPSPVEPQSQPVMAVKPPVEEHKTLEIKPVVISTARRTDHIDEASLELREAFLEEADEHLQNITRVLRLLEKDASNKGWQQEIRRSVHTLKGAAGMVGFQTVSRLAHRMEDLLDAVYEDDLELTTEIIALIFVTTDTLEDLLHKGSAEVRERAEDLYQRFAAFLGTELADMEPVSGGTRLEPLGQESMIDLAGMIPERRREADQSKEDEQADLQRQPSQVVRVPIERLDELVRLVSELIVSRSTFEQYFRKLNHEVDELRLSVGRSQRIANRFDTEYEVSALGKGMASLVNVAAVGAGNGFTISASPVKQTHGFDELEFDRYTEFHLLTRELSENTGDINAVSNELHNTIGDFDSYLNGLNRLTSEVQDKLMRLRMVPVGSLTARLHRTVRVTAEHQAKLAKLTVEGEQVELDKTVLEEIADPLLHILRNAVDHGIEPPALRQALGKPKIGHIRVRAFYEATQVVIQVSDDGGGIEPEVIRAAAVRRGHISEPEAAHLTDEEIYSFLFLPGFSTASEVSEISGRGVGMDIVKETVTRMKGTVAIHSVPGQGMTLTIRLPMTLAILRVILVKASTETFAIPLAPVTRILRIEKDDIEHIGQKEVIRVEGEVYPLLQLGTVLNLKQPADETLRRVPVLILNLGSQQIAVAVDQLLEAREVVVKSMGNLLQRVPGVAGATLMGDGSVVLILNPNELVRTTTQPEIQPRSVVRTPAKTREALRVLIVDDSVSVRRVLSNFVRNQGWTPTEARDGLEALELLQSGTINPDVVLLDIEMPRMDGYELTATVRSNNALKHIPIVMLTSRAGEKHRRKAMDVGATDYLVKPYQEEVLLGVMRRLTQ